MLEGDLENAAGDYKRAPDPTCALFEPQRCDVFITEATFAMPIYRWQPKDGPNAETAHVGPMAQDFAAAFHKSAIILLPIAALAATRNKYWTAIWVGVVTVLAYGAFLQDSVDRLYVNYIEAEYQSQGAFIRGAMNFLPACIYLLFRKRFLLQPVEANLWRWFSIISIALFVNVVASVATTVAVPLPTSA